MRPPIVRAVHVTTAVAVSVDADVWVRAKGEAKDVESNDAGSETERNCVIYQAYRAAKRIGSAGSGYVKHRVMSIGELLPWLSSHVCKAAQEW